MMGGRSGGGANEAVRALLDLASNPEEFRDRLKSIEEREQRAITAEERAVRAAAVSAEAESKALAAIKASQQDAEKLAADKVAFESLKKGELASIEAQREAVTSFQGALRKTNADLEVAKDNVEREHQAIRARMAELDERVVATNLERERYVAATREAELRKDDYERKLANLKSMLA